MPINPENPGSLTDGPALAIIGTVVVFRLEEVSIPEHFDLDGPAIDGHPLFPPKQEQCSLALVVQLD